MCPQGEIFVPVGLFYRMGNDPSLLQCADKSAHTAQQRGVSRGRAEKRKAHTLNNLVRMCAWTLPCIDVDQYQDYSGLTLVL